MIARDREPELRRHLTTPLRGPNPDTSRGKTSGSGPWVTGARWVSPSMVKRPAHPRATGPSGSRGFESHPGHIGSVARISTPGTRRMISMESGAGLPGTHLPALGRLDEPSGDESVQRPSGRCPSTRPRSLANGRRFVVAASSPSVVRASSSSTSHTDGARARRTTLAAGSTVAGSQAASVGWAMPSPTCSPIRRSSARLETRRVRPIRTQGMP